MEMEKIAHVNEMQIIGKVLTTPEKLTAAGGKPYLRVIVETERFVIMPDKSRQRIAQTHTVVIRRQASIAMFEANVRPGVTIRIVGELCYDPKPEIVVWEHLGTAVLMSIPHPSVSGQAQAPASGDKQAAQGSNQAQRLAPASSGGAAKMPAGEKKMNVGAVKSNEQSTPDFDVDDDDGDDAPNSASAIFDSPVFQLSNSLDDEIPF